MEIFRTSTSSLGRSAGIQSGASTVCDPFGHRLGTGWHVRLHYLRRYGAIAALGDLPERAGDWDLDEPIVAVTIARMNLRELPRFLRWGRPVERLIASRPAAVFSTGAQRPPNTISTFAIWRTVREMTEMVHGRSDLPDAHVLQVAMAEQRRRDVHHESTFMRVRPLSEHGQWQGPAPPAGRRAPALDAMTQSVGRSGVLAASVAMACGMPLQAALEMISKARGVPVPETQVQRDWLQRIEPRLSNPDR